MDVWQEIFNIIVYGKAVKKNIPITSTITAYLLREGIGKKSSFQNELHILDKFLSPLYENKQIHTAYNGFNIFTPHVKADMLNRYEAIKKEISAIKPDILIIGACGFSPLGLAYAMENPGKYVIDTDLADIIYARKILEAGSPKNYNIQILDLLDEKSVASFCKKIKDIIPSVCSKSMAIVAEGLTFYFDEKQREILNKNLHTLAKEIKPENPSSKFILEFYISERPSKERDFKPSSIDPYLFKIFYKISRNITSGQKCFMKSVDEVKKHL
ncbi:hypothetical protein KY335_03765, partial [Candidatus Woesearchaeota archaeon]|nr:hypothetical protein [Candidatus Woesearchaeota archaeon]